MRNRSAMAAVLLCSFLVAGQTLAAGEKATITGEVIVANGGAGRSVYY